MYFYNVEIILHPQEVIFLVFDLFNVIAHILGWKKPRNGILFFLFYYLFLTNIIIWLCPVDIKSKGRLVYIGSIKQIVSWQIVLLIVKLVCFKANFWSYALILVGRICFFAFCRHDHTGYLSLCQNTNVSYYRSGQCFSFPSYVSSNRPVARHLPLMTFCHTGYHLA